MWVDIDDLIDGQSVEDVQISMAYEYFYFNIQGAWIGDNTPIFISKLQN